MAVTPRRITLAEFLQLPEEKPPLELRSGIVTRMSPKGPHGTLAFELGFRLVSASGAGHRLRMCIETRFSIGGESFVVDLLGYQAARIPIDGHGDVAEDFLTPPDVVVEVMSRGQVLGGMIERCRDMARLGVPLVLLLQPRTRTARVFRDGWESEPLRGTDLVDFSHLVPGFSLSVDAIFRPLHVRDSQQDQ